MRHNHQQRYRDKIILAPMVRIGTIPMRLLALDYGADLVYSEEIIDYKLMKCRRVLNDRLSTIDFIDIDGRVVFRTCDKERNKVILQIGTSDAERCLKAAKNVEADVSGIDINMGCPKDFSIKGGMGAALLKNPRKIEEILQTLTSNLTIPVTCKIRVLPSLEKTVEIAKTIESSGAVALAVHARTKEERYQESNRNDYIRCISRSLRIPVIASGGSDDIQTYDDISLFVESTQASSVMLARAAQNNCSIFRPEGLLDVHSVIREYLKYAVRYEVHPGNAKYCIQRMLGSEQASDVGQACNHSSTMDQLCSLWQP